MLALPTHLRVRAPLFAALVLASGCSPTPEASQKMRAHELSLAVETGDAKAGQFAAWHGGFGEGSSIYIQELDADGNSIGEPIQVSDGVNLSYEPDLIIANGQRVVAWYEKNDDTGALSTLIAGLNANDDAWLTPFGSGTDTARNAVVRQIGDQLHVAWIEETGDAGEQAENETGVWHQRFSLSGEAMGEPQQIGLANDDTWNLNASVSGENLLITYDANLGSQAHELHLLIVGTDGQAKQHILSPDDGFASFYPDLQISATGQAVLTWFDEKDGNQEVYVSAGSLDAITNGDLPNITRVSHNEGDSIGAYAAWNGQIIGLAWSDELAGERQTFVQTFSSEGQALSPVQQLSEGEKSSSVPSIRASGDGFLIGWNDYAISGDGAHASITTSTAEISWVSAETAAAE